MTEFRRHLLTIGEQVARNGSWFGELVDIDRAFAESLIRNLQAVSMVPVITGPEHSEDPGKTIALVDSIKIEGDEVFVTFRAHGKPPPYAYAAISLDYLNTETGEHVGPTLLHVLLKNNQRTVIMKPEAVEA